MIDAQESFRQRPYFTDHDLPAYLAAQNGIQKIIISGIRTEQCCETTARHASDEGYAIDYVLDATLTWDMPQADGQTLTAADIRSRTATVLDGRFATVCTVAELLYI